MFFIYAGELIQFCIFFPHRSFKYKLPLLALRRDLFVLSPPTAEARNSPFYNSPPLLRLLVQPPTKAWKNTNGVNKEAASIINDETGQESILCPGEVLSHELHHAYGFLTNPSAWVTQSDTKNYPATATDNTYNLKEVKRVITSGEYIFDKYINPNAVTRNNHRGEYIKAKSILPKN